ncbi:hypothetical protein [Caballeronia cordobensis]|nr:hypothetical protein BRPE67_CCDS08220 [Burkholderia sp. RPE67]
MTPSAFREFPASVPGEAHSNHECGANDPGHAATQQAHAARTAQAFA